MNELFAFLQQPKIPLRLLRTDFRAVAARMFHFERHYDDDYDDNDDSNDGDDTGNNGNNGNGDKGDNDDDSDDDDDYDDNDDDNDDDDDDEVRRQVSHARP